MFCVSTNKRRNLCPYHGPHSAIPWPQTVCHRGRLVRNSFRAFAGKLHILPTVLWKQDVTWRRRGYRCIFQYSKYSPRHSHCRGSWARDTYVAPSSARKRFILRWRHEQRGIQRGRKLRHCPHSGILQQMHWKSTHATLLSCPCSKLFQIQRVELSLALREIWHFKGSYSFLNSLSAHGSSKSLTK